jgi:hypothetical protein
MTPTLWLATLIKLALSIVLIALSLEDLRHGQVRKFLPVTLIVVVLLRTITGWPALGVLLGAGLILGERDGKFFRARRLAAGMLVLLSIWISLHDGSILAVVMWLLVIAEWRANILGGADAQIQLLLLALFPTLTMVWLVLLVPSLVRLVYLWRQRRGRQPMIPAYALAGLLYVWLVIRF